MKATEFYWQDLIQNHFPQSWKIQEVINYGRSKDKDFYPASKKGTEVHLNVMHGANLLLALATGATKANIEKTLKMRFILRSQQGTYFMNDLAELLKDPNNFVPDKRVEGSTLKGVKEIRISTLRAYAEIVSVDRSGIIEVVDVYGGGGFHREQVEEMTIISHKFLDQYSGILNNTAGVHGQGLTAEQINQIHSYKRIESL